MTGAWPPPWWDGALAREILQRSGEHLLLVGTALGLALAISLPLGLWISRRPRWAGVVLAAASTVQTIPSLAIFGLLITVPLLGGIGTNPAIVALTLYALLPLLRGLVTGLAQVPPGLKEAGLRVATVIGVGVATIAAAIGAGGLGVFIFRGIATVNNSLILAGALPAAAIALAADGGQGLLERRLAQRRPKAARRGGRRSRRVAGSLAALALAAVVGLRLLPTAGGGTVRIGSKSFTEQLILGELLAQQIEADTSLKVQRDFGLGGSGLIHEAVRRGRIDGYVEYTGTAWTTLLGQTPPPPETLDPARKVFEDTRRLYAARFGLAVFPSLGFENSFAILVRRGEAKRLGIASISAAAPHTPGWRAGFGYEFLNRPDGFPGLVRRYGLRFAGPPEAMDLGLTYRALAEGQVDLIAGDSTNGLIPALDLQQLTDDRHYFPPYDAVPVFNAASLRRHPELEPVITALSGRIPAATMQRLNAQVDLEGRSVAEVVRGWRLQEAGDAGSASGRR
ncbi:glycine betaine ABC transporter substrate-binding protein [Synechococcus sp. CCY 9618]|uniref:glycine betaine ABC transporter substrate-binding protein n=1 Tax=Synechococcus sp. CCY 9618 TaxID=2815602 RepID=UPI001C2395F0